MLLPERRPPGLARLPRLAHSYRPLLEVACRDPKEPAKCHVSIWAAAILWLHAVGLAIIRGTCTVCGPSMEPARAKRHEGCACRRRRPHPRISRSRRQHVPSTRRTSGRRSAATGTRLASVDPMTRMHVKTRRNGSRSSARQSPMHARTSRNIGFLGTAALCGMKGMMPVAGSSKVRNFSIEFLFFSETFPAFPRILWAGSESEENDPSGNGEYRSTRAVAATTNTAHR